MDHYERGHASFAKSVLAFVTHHDNAVRSPSPVYLQDALALLSEI